MPDRHGPCIYCGEEHCMGWYEEYLRLKRIIGHLYEQRGLKRFALYTEVKRAYRAAFTEDES